MDTRIRIFICFILCVLVISSCKKWQDPQAQNDPRISSRRFCNDPLAVNYNWDFPGIPDNSLCVYPSDLFKGTYLYTDSVYSKDNVFDSAGSLVTYMLQFLPLNSQQFAVVGFCTNDSLLFTGERTTFRAHADTTIMGPDTSIGYGQFFCRTLDTITGSITKNRTDTSRLYFDFTVVSDTGVNYHRGTAIKQ